MKSVKFVFPDAKRTHTRSYQKLCVVGERNPGRRNISVSIFY